MPLRTGHARYRATGSSKPSTDHERAPECGPLPPGATAVGVDEAARRVHPVCRHPQTRIARLPIALRVAESHCSHSGGDWGSRSACSSSPRHERRDRSGTVRQSQDGQRPRLEHSPRTWSVEPPRGSRPGGEPANLRSVPRSREISASVAHRASKCRQSAHQIVSVTADALHSPRSPADHPLSRRSIAGPPPLPIPAHPAAPTPDRPDC